MGALAARPGHGAPGRAAPPRFELRCCSCGYGAVVRIAPDRCPMCSGSVWEQVPGRPSRRPRVG